MTRKGKCKRGENHEEEVMQGEWICKEREKERK
jgi:hypothetical protein